jgi:glycosyltransferase involved in cell wall biosynthesis
MKVIMYGFGSGNNIEPWLEFFEQNHDDYQLDFVCRSFQLKADAFPNIRIAETKSLYWLGFPLLFRLRKEKYDVVYIQGLYDYLIVLQMLLLTRTRLRVVNIWNNRNFRKASLENRKTWQIPLYRLIFALTHRFYFTWYGTFTDFGSLFPSQQKKRFIQPWGIRNRIIEGNPVAISEFAIQYLNSLHPDDLFLFWPENLSPDEHLDIFLEALGKIPLKNNLRVLIFCGHQKSESEYSEYLRSLIRKYRLHFVDLVLGNYLPYSDIMAFWQRADLSIKLSTKDQLSNGIIEALFFKTPLVLNNWLPYNMLGETGFHVFLTELNPDSIASTFTNLIDKLSSNKDYYEKEGDANNKIIREKFNFDRNIGLLMQELDHTVQEKRTR